MNKMPFGKNDHVRIVKTMAHGLHSANALSIYLELGIRRGPAFNTVAPLVKKEAFAVDINKECYKYIKHNENLRWFHGKSEDFLRSHPPEKKFDLVFIDADHSHSASMKDFDLVFPFVRDNGLILLHDTYPPSEEFTSSKYCSDTYKTAEFIRRSYPDQCEICTLPFYFGISIVRKLDRQLLWRDDEKSIS